MAISLAAAAIGSAVIGAGASAISSSKNSKAIKSASKAQQAATDANTALQRETYAKNEGALSPFIQRGNAAGATFNALLGLGGTPTTPTMPTPQPSALSPYGYEGMDGVYGPRAMSEARYNAFEGPFSEFAGGQAPQPTTAQVSPQQAALEAYNIFKQSTGYTTRLDEGARTVNAAYAARGLSRSGAADKARIKYGQNFASNEFGNYLGYLGNQQGVGLSGASALAGVSQNFANNVSALNQNQAQFAGQAAIARANNTNSLITGIGGALTGALGAFGGTSSYKIPPAIIPYGDGTNMTGGIFRRTWE